ncbi:hypothetical protein PR202_gb01649 [Eleusine coracana subsp. coracana]|uniref:VQ domain-containing protein n=1 Tax=Eleusine coracana subsp. coracana TaxID=191504 RepID=A0AAV5DUQ3_ELECO|nr:hypothetical protein PR202_gb01649 [Eleusine coracana subsp. coracana]
MEGGTAAATGNAHGGAAAATGNKRKGKSGGGGGGNKKPIKVVYIDNPMRVTTSAEGFRALVQELTGRHADPSKYSGGAIDVDDNDSSGGSLQADPQPGALLPISPGGSTEGSSDASAAAAAAGQVPAQAPGFEDDEESFMPQLIDNSYSVFSPPTFLYYGHNDNELM